MKAWRDETCQHIRRSNRLLGNLILGIIGLFVLLASCAPARMGLIVRDGELVNPDQTSIRINGTEIKGKLPRLLKRGDVIEMDEGSTAVINFAKAQVYLLPKSIVTVGSLDCAWVG